MKISRHSHLRQNRQRLQLFSVLSGLALSGLALSGLVWIGSGMAQVPPAIQTRSVLQVGSQGEDVKEVQAILRLLGFYNGSIDGVFNDMTRSAVVQFQLWAGVAPDGLVGVATWTKLLPPAPGETPVSVAAPMPGPPPVVTPPPPAQTLPTPVVPASIPPTNPILRQGTTGPWVTRLQQRLQALGIYTGPVDGVFGVETELAVKAAQGQYGLAEDGVVGPATWAALGI
jgi:peptidoglycan hydrolase-like protein with peptidoglycan-binding domain